MHNIGRQANNETLGCPYFKFRIEKLYLSLIYLADLGFT